MNKDPEPVMSEASTTPTRPPNVPEGYGPTGVRMSTGEEVYREFRAFHSWVNKAQTWMRRGDACFDQKGRRCWNGGDMMRARDEGAFPVTIARRIS